jgi:Ser/Thr protein kinase RdoA (MazF antagonist)
MNNTTIKQVLLSRYGVDDVKLSKVEPGWSALAYCVKTGNDLYFLKIYDKTRHSSQVWTQGIDRYIPAVVWLNKHTPQHKKIPCVIPTVTGDYKYEDDERVFILFEWVEGITPRDKPLTRTQLASLAQIVADLHSFDESLLTTSNVVCESYDIPFYESLLSRANNSDPNIPSEYLKLITQKLHQLAEISQTLPTFNLPFVLCHNDIHGWNVITQNDELILLDWEGLRFSPREADLFMFKYERYWNQRWDEFYDMYKKTHPQLELNETAMHFFRLRRRLNDIDEFVSNIVLDNESDEVIAEAKRLLVQECELLI